MGVYWFHCPNPSGSETIRLYTQVAEGTSEKKINQKELKAAKKAERVRDCYLIFEQAPFHYPLSDGAKEPNVVCIGGPKRAGGSHSYATGRRRSLRRALWGPSAYPKPEQV
jgi:hypothetical protein